MWIQPGTLRGAEDNTAGAPARGGRRVGVSVRGVERLEARMLLAAAFANLTYTDPFPAPVQLGQPSQGAGSVLYSESFTDRSGTSNGLLGAADRYWNQQSTVTRSLPGSMQNGLAQMSVEFWLNVPVGGTMGNLTAIKMPGFEVGGSSNWARTPSGVISLKLTTTRSGEPLAHLGQVLGVIADGQWHQYVATFDGQGAHFYSDGELVGQDWVTNAADRVGPQIFSGSSVSTPTAISYTPLVNNTNAKFDEVRVSNVALTPAQVKRNFENCHTYSATWYVSPTGLSTNSGTRSSPLDLTTGLSHVAADNKVVLLSGTYSGAQFQVARSGAGALHNALITGDEGSGQVIIQTSGSGTGPTVSGGAKYVTLRNLTFSSDQQAGLTFSASGYGNVLDGCRITSNVDALSVVNSSGYQDPMSGDANHYIIVPGVMLENSVLAAGASSAGVRYSNSDAIIARNNTFTGGQYGAYLTGGSTNVTLLDNIFTGQTGSGVYFSSDSLMDVNGAYSLVSYFGDGNIYNPSGSGYVATVIDGTTNNYSTVSDYAKYWYTKQYGAAILTNYGDSGSGIGTRSEQRSVRGVPAFVFSGNGDFRLAATAPNLIDTGADRVFGRTRQGVSATVWDGQGIARAQGNAVDAGAYETAGAVSQTFTLATAATTSAGVYDISGKLIRTLWSGKQYPAGSVTAYWNGLNDKNAAVSNGSYTIKLLSNNVQYSWDGAMNTSNPISGPTVQANFLPIQSMVVIGSTAYYTPGYNEGRYMLNAFELSNPQATTARGVITDNYVIDVIEAVATDGSTLFTVSEHTSNHQILLRAYSPSNLNSKLREITVTASGAAAGGESGIAVQPAGKQDLVFVVQKNEGRVYLYNKNTFAAYSTPYLDGSALGWNTPQAVAVTSDGDLWIACKNTSSGQWQVVRYTNFGAAPTLAATVTGGLVNPAGLAVSVDGNKTLLVADTEDSAGNVHQQIKAYANTGGAALWTLGQAGGYATNGPTITNDKFILHGMICPQSDGSFWITDLATENRTMHFSAARAFISDIQYARSYSAAGDQNDATRVFQNFVEYQIDYSKAFTQNQGWTPVKNWNYVGTRNLLPFANYGGFDGLSVVSTLSNGRTYALVNAQTLSGNSADAGKLSIVELTANGLRDTGYKTANSSYWMDKDGSLLTASTSGSTARFSRLAMTGFDASGNPKYATSATLLGTAPWSRTWDASTPYPDGTPYYAPRFLQLDNGLLVTYNAAAHAAGMHLGAVNPATNQWQWQTMPGAGPFDGTGNYDTASWYGGNRVMASGSNIVTGYNGEGWGANMGQGQANQFMHYSDDGLFIGQFGMGQLNGGGTYPSAYGSGGNSFSPFLTSNGGDLYLYANDEGDRSLNRWSVTGLDTLQETSLGVTVGVLAAPSGLSATAASQTQINLAWTDNSGIETGFKVDRATDAGFTAGLTTVTVGANVTTYSSTGLTANTTYYYRVRAIDAGSESANTSTASATTLPGVPTAPSGLTGTAVSTSQVNLTWTDNSDSEVGFVVERSIDQSIWTPISNSVVNVPSTIWAGMSFDDISTGAYRPATQVGGVWTFPLDTSKVQAWTASGSMNKMTNSYIGSSGAAWGGAQVVGPNTGSNSTATGFATNSFESYHHYNAGTPVVLSNDTNTAFAGTTTGKYEFSFDISLPNLKSYTLAGMTARPGLYLLGDLGTKSWYDGSINLAGAPLLGIVFDSGNIYAQGGNGTLTLVSGASVSTAYHLSAILDMDANTIDLYVNGAKIGGITQIQPADGHGIMGLGIEGGMVAYGTAEANEIGLYAPNAYYDNFAIASLSTVTTLADVSSYSDTGLAANTTYYYRVRATNLAGDSANSNTAGPVMPLLQVNGDQGSAGQSDQIRVARNASDTSLLDVFLNSVTPTYSVNFASLYAISVNGLGGDDTLTLDLANGAVIPAGGISYDGGTQAGGDNLIITGASGNDAIALATNQVTINSGVVTLTGVENRSFSGVQHLGSLTLSGGSKLTLPEGGQSTLVVQSLSVDATSSLDVADNAVIVDYTGSNPFAAIYSLVATSARNHWAGNGIVSHTAAGGGSEYAIGVADNAVANLASFAGQTVDATSVLIRFTYCGDANLDGQVDLTDLSILAGSWQMPGRQWGQGDSDYSGSVDLTDLSLLASNWQKVLPVPALAPAPAPVPMAAEVVSLTSETAVASQTVDAASAAEGNATTSAEVAADPVLVPRDPMAAPAAAGTVLVARAAGKPAGVSVANERAVGIAPVAATRLTAGVFSNRPLSSASALAPWPMRGQGVQTLLGIGSDENRDVLLGAGDGKVRGFSRGGRGVARGLMGQGLTRG